MPNKKIAILGGGLAGLTLANLLQKKYDVTVFEKDSVPGGLCRSFIFNGFTFDIGGHIIFSKDQTILDFMVKTVGLKNLYKNPGRDAIVYKGKFVNYPFETDLAKLGKNESYECLYDYFINDKKNPKDFHQWLHFTFGKSLAEKYLVPYNRKVWKIDPKELDMNWVAKIPKPNPEEMIKSCMGIPFDIKFARKDFYYPKKGGIQALTDNLAKNIKNLHLNSEVSSLKKNHRGWKIQVNNEKFEFDDIISTIPVFHLFNILGKSPKKVSSALKKMRYNSIAIVCLGIDSKNITEKTAFYFPDEDFFPNRVCFMKNFSPETAPKGKSSIICEITFHPQGKISKTKDGIIINNAIKGLEKRGIIPKNKVIFQKLLKFPYAYVVYDKNYSKQTKVVYDWLKKENIKTVGRFAEFQYLNMDACIRHAFDFVNNYK
jgi:protoporphyrinogen oxidase